LIIVFDRAVGGAEMSTGLYGFELSRLSALSHSFPHWPEQATARLFKPKLVWLTAVVLAGLSAWVLLPAHPGDTAESDTPVLVANAPDEPVLAPLTEAVQQQASFDPATAEAIVPEQPTPLEKLRISSQSWRRGGLGSIALVTLTLRNKNDYAVKDIEVACAFARRDGSHLTDRNRVIHESVNKRSRKTFARIHVGFVNINASRAKCAIIGAARI
jgi:hypothetical protein